MQCVCYIKHMGRFVDHINICFHAVLDLFNTVACFFNSSLYRPVCSRHSPQTFSKYMPIINNYIIN